MQCAKGTQQMRDFLDCALISNLTHILTPSLVLGPLEWNNS